MTAGYGTLLRLERNKLNEQEQALSVTRDAYGELAEAVLQVAQQAGYLGQDPLAGLGQLLAPSSDERRQAELVLELWQLFFASFREDEQAYEAVQFSQRAGELEAHIQALAPGEDPSPQLLAAVLETLCTFWQERQHSLSSRLDELIQQLGAKNNEAESSGLRAAYQEDELQGVRKVVMAALLELGRSVNTESSFAKDVEHLVAVYRRRLRQRSEELEREKATAAANLVWLRRVLGDSEAEEPSIKPAGEAKQLLKQCLEIVRDREGLDQAYRQLHEEHAKVKAELREYQEQLQARDQLLTRYEFGERAHVDEDERLRLYRLVVSRYEAGEQPGPELDEVRQLEMVILLDRGQEQEHVDRCDRQLGMLAKCLTDLRKVMALTDDPKRYRPRLLGSSVYRFKTLIGQFQALRDAGRDVLAYIDRARWVQGLEILQKEFRRLKRVFQEMVKLCADLRQRAGAEPPVSMTISLDTTGGLASLPAVLADDVESLVRKKGVGPKTQQDLVDLLEETVKLYHGALVKAIGKNVERSEVPKRESPRKALERLCQDLRDLSAQMDAVFAEAAAAEYEPAADELKLVTDMPRLILAVQQVDAAVQAMALLPGAPGADLAKLPGGQRPDCGALLDACRSRVSWLETLAQYRVVME